MNALRSLNLDHQLGNLSLRPVVRRVETLFDSAARSTFSQMRTCRSHSVAVEYQKQ